MESALLKFLVELASRKMDDDSSAYYLPALIKSQQNPTYEPYHAGDWDLGEIKPSLGLLAGLTDAVVTGLSNVQLHQWPTVSADNVVSGTANFGVVDNTTAGELSIAGGLTAEISGSKMPPATFSMAIQNMSAEATIAVTGGTQINAETTALLISIPQPYTTSIKITVTISVQESFDWGKLMTQELNQESTLATIVGKLHDQLNSSTVRNDFSTEITKVLNNLS